MSDFSIAFSSLIGKWDQFFEWFAQRTNLEFDTFTPGEPQHCPIHGGESGEAFRFYDDFLEQGGGICNSCINLKASNGINLAAGFLMELHGYTKDTARAEALSLVENFLMEKRIPPQSINCAKQLHRFFGFTENAIALAYFRNRGIPLDRLPPGVKGTSTLYKRAPDNKGRNFNAAAGLLKSKGGLPLTYHYVLLDDQYEKLDMEGMRTKSSAFINKEKSLSGAYVDLTSETETFSDTIIFGEGMETVLAAKYISRTESQARAKVGGGGSYSNLLIPEGIKTAIYALDNDHTLEPALQELESISAQNKGIAIYAAVPPSIEGIDKPDWLNVLVENPTEATDIWHSSLREIKGLIKFSPKSKPAEEALENEEPEENSLGGSYLLSPDQIEQAVFDEKARALVNLSDLSDVLLFKLFDKLIEQKAPENWYVYTLSKEVVLINANMEIIPVKEEDVGVWISNFIEFGKISHTRDGMRISYTGTPAQRVKTWWRADRTKRLFQARLNPLKAVINKPILNRDITTSTVSLLSGDGYDAQHHYYFNIDPTYKNASDLADKHLAQLNQEYDLLPASDKDDMSRAAFHRRNISMLWAHYFKDEILYDFEFASKSDESNLYSAFFAPLLAGMVSSTPFIMVEAPQRGSGKTFLAKATTSIWGHSPNIGLDDNADELQKTLVSAFSEGHNQILIDNISGYIKSDILARLLTDPRNTTFRILGGNKIIKPPENMVLVGTANNAQIQEEIMRRTLVIRLEPKALDPAQRTTQDFKHPNLLEVIERNKEMLASIIYLTIKSWLDSGAPEFSHAHSFTGFEEWSTYSHIFMWWGGLPSSAHFIENRKELLNQGDQDVNDIETFLELWARTFGFNEPLMAQSLVTAAHENELPFGSVFQKSNVNEQSKQMGRELNPLLGRRFLLSDGTIVAIQKKKAHRFVEKNNMPYVAFLLKRLQKDEPAPPAII